MGTAGHDAGVQLRAGLEQTPIPLTKIGPARTENGCSRGKSQNLDFRGVAGDKGIQIPRIVRGELTLDHLENLAHTNLLSGKQSFTKIQPRSPA